MEQTMTEVELLAPKLPDAVVETNEPKENWALVTVESALSLEPLLSRPEWFDQNHPAVITKEMIESLPNVTKATLERYEKAAKLYGKYPTAVVEINERMNPFRSNTLTSMITPAIGVFVRGVDSEVYRNHAHTLFGDQSAEVAKTVSRVLDGITDRKNTGIGVRRVEELIEKENSVSDPDTKKIARLNQLLYEAEIASSTPIEEVKKVFDLGKLTSFVIRDCDKMPIIFGDGKELLEKVLSPLPEVHLFDFNRKFDEIRYGDYSI